MRSGRGLKVERGSSYVLVVENFPFVGFIPPRTLESVTPSLAITVVALGELDRAWITSTWGTVAARGLGVGVLRNPNKLTRLLRILHGRPELRDLWHPSITAINDDIHRVDGIVAVDDGFG